MQATVRDWDPSAGGSAFLDDGTVMILPLECLQDSVFRFLRLGQRIELEVRGQQVVRVGLPGS